MDRQIRQRNYILVALLLLTLLGLVRLTAGARQRLSWVESFAVEAFSLLQRPAQTAGNIFGSLFASFGELRDLAGENERLRNELDILTRKYNGLVESEIENQSLKELLGFKQSSPYDVVEASVVGRSPSQWYQTILLDKGSADGVAKDMPVVTGKGLVGKILNTTTNTSTVLLVLDPDCGVGGYVQRSRDFGVVLGLFGAVDTIEMRLFSQDSSAAVGDIVYTSGLGGVFPREIPIGVIDAIVRKEYGLTAFARIRPYVDFNRLEDVLVVKYTGETGV